MDSNEAVFAAGEQEQPPPAPPPQPQTAVTITPPPPSAPAPKWQSVQEKVAQPQKPQPPKPFPPQVSCCDPKPSVVTLGTICLILNLILSGITALAYVKEKAALRNSVDEVYYIGVPSAEGLHLFSLLIVFIGSCKRSSCLLWFSLFLNVVSLLGWNGIYFYFSRDEYNPIILFILVALDVLTIWLWVCLSVFAVFPDEVVRTFYYGQGMRMGVSYQQVQPVMIQQPQVQVVQQPQQVQVVQQPQIMMAQPLPPMYGGYGYGGYGGYGYGGFGGYGYGGGFGGYGGYYDFW